MFYCFYSDIRKILNLKEGLKDPFFDGKGPERAGCRLCGGCMVGCRFNAKNTLDKNYLYLAEKAGAQIIPETLATEVIPIDGNNGEMS